MLWNVYYTWQGEKYNAGQYSSKSDALARMREVYDDGRGFRAYIVRIK